MVNAEAKAAACPCPNCKGHETPAPAPLAVVPAPPAPLKLDLGCGKLKAEGFTGVDVRPFEGVDVVADLRMVWPWPDESVDEVHCGHFVEHLTPSHRIHFVNELCRVLKKGAKATLVVPHWNSSRAYGDLTHEWPPVSEYWFYYLNKSWREVNAPHNDEYRCDFDFSYGYKPHPELEARSQEYTAFAVSHYREMAQDLMATLTKR